MGRRKRVGDMRTGRGRSSISGIIFSRNLGKFYVLGLSESALSMASAAGLYARLRRALATTNSSHSFFWRTLSLAAAQAKNFYVFGCGWWYHWYNREIVLLAPHYVNTEKDYERDYQATLPRGRTADSIRVQAPSRP